MKKKGDRRSRQVNSSQVSHKAKEGKAGGTEAHAQYWRKRRRLKPKASKLGPDRVLKRPDWQAAQWCNRPL